MHFYLFCAIVSNLFLQTKMVQYIIKNSTSVQLSGCMNFWVTILSYKFFHFHLRFFRHFSYLEDNQDDTVDHWLFKWLSGETRHNQGKVYSLSVLCTALLERLPVKVEARATCVFKHCWDLKIPNNGERLHSLCGKFLPIFKHSHEGKVCNQSEPL